MPGQDDLWAWLQSIGGNDSWLSQPYGGHSTNYGPPKGGPGVGQPGPQQPQQGGDDPLGFSVGVNPHGDGPPDVMSPAAMYQAQYGGPTAAADAAHAPPSAPFVQPQHPSTMRYPMWPTPPAPQGTPSATPQPADSGPKGPLASPSNTATPMKRRAGAPNLGYYQGNPRFSTFQYETPNSSASRAPIYTAMNLFGGQQPAANPDAPAAAAQPVSSPMSGITPAAGDAPLPAAAYANAPMPPVMPGDIRNKRVANAVSAPNWWQNL